MSIDISMQTQPITSIFTLSKLDEQAAFCRGSQCRYSIDQTELELGEDAIFRSSIEIVDSLSWDTPD